MERLPLAGQRWSVAALTLLLPLASMSSSAAAQRGYQADLHYERGAHALRKGDPGAAAADLARAVELAPADPDALGLYARALLLLERPDEALDMLEDLRQIEPSAPDLSLMLGLAHSRLGQWGQARDHLEAARRSEPRDARIHFFLGMAYQELGESDAAERELRAALDLDPTLELPRAYRLALLALRENRRDEARRLFEEVLTRLPGSSLANSAATYLIQMEEGEARRWNAWATAGVGYDTNVNLFGDSLAAGEISRESDTFSELEAGIEGLAWEGERTSLRLGYRGDLTAHRDEKKLDIEANQAWAVLSYDLTERLGVDLRYDLGWVWVDWKSFLRTNAIEPALRFYTRNDLYTRVFYRFADRSFFDETTDDLDRDGRVQVAGIDQYWILPDFRGWGGGFARIGLRFRDEDTQGREFDSNGPIGIVTLVLPLPSELILTLDGWYERRDFEHRSRTFEESVEGEREDHITRFRIQLRRQLNPHIDLTAGWRYTHWSSNVGVYDFDQAVSVLRLTYRY